LKDGASKKKAQILPPNNRIKTDTGKLTETLRGKVLCWRGLCGALDSREFPKRIYFPNIQSSRHVKLCVAYRNPPCSVLLAYTLVIAAM